MSRSLEKPNRVKDHLVFCSFSRSNVEQLMQGAINKLDDHVISITKQAAIGALETRDVEHN